MEPTGTAPAGGTQPTVQVTERQNEVSRIENIRAVAKAHACEDKLSEWIGSGKNELEVVREINAILTERIKTPVQTSRGIELSDKDHKRFSFARALLLDSALARELGAEKVDTGFEREIMEEARRRSPGMPGKGLFIPMVTRANVDSATNTTGGPFKFTQPGDFIEMLRNRSSVMRAGSTVLQGLTGPVSFPKQTGAVSGSWVAENPGADLSRSAMVTSTVTLAFKTVQAASAVSRQALFSAASGNYDLEQIIRQDLATVIALTIDLGALNGPGTANQPTGVLQNTSIGSVTLGANGGTMAWANWVALETAIADANADAARMAYITNTKQRGVAKNKAVLDATASGIPIWGGSLFASGLQETPTTVQDGLANGYRAIASNQVPRNLTKGTATTVCSAVLFGAFEHLIVGQFGAGFEVLVDPYTLKLQGMIDLTAWNFVDVALRYPEAFAAVKDAL